MGYILGVTSMDDASATLIKDGRIIAAAAEERFTRIKHYSGFPENAIRYCLKETGITVNDVVHIAYSWVPWKGIFRNTLEIIKELPKNKSLFKSRATRGPGYLKERLFILRLKDIVKKRFNHNGKNPLRIHFIEHHLAHAASCYYLSPFKKAAILTMDGMGEKTTIMIAKGDADKITKLKEVNYPHSIGHFYSTFTSFLGFKIHSDEGKIMGLASYGNKETYKEKFSKLFSIDDNGNFRLNTPVVSYQTANQGIHSKKFLSMFGKPRIPETKLSTRHYDIAAGLQSAVEEIGVKLAKCAYKLTKSKNICLAGGVALNSAMNCRILEELPFENIYIQPAAGDDGTSLGAAVYISNKIGEQPVRMEMKNAYLGTHYSDQEIKKDLDRLNLDYTLIKDPSKEAAKLISKGKIVGWFQGRMEFGPRALGNRSILADPRDPTMKDKLNAKVKHRESFRPFAPSVLIEHYKDYFKVDVPVPHMLLITDVIESKKKIIPSVTHVDGTARLQTVDNKINQLYWGLINHFYQITGVPVILNTSFNTRGKPIVESPSDAIECLLSTDMGYLFIGNFIVKNQH